MKKFFGILIVLAALAQPAHAMQGAGPDDNKPNEQASKGTMHQYLHDYFIDLGLVDCINSDDSSIELSESAKAREKIIVKLPEKDKLTEIFLTHELEDFINTTNIINYLCEENVDLETAISCIHLEVTEYWIGNMIKHSLRHSEAEKEDQNLCNKIFNIVLNDLLIGQDEALAAMRHYVDELKNNKSEQEKLEEK